jgi:predicted PurR-regulated permease PerM
VMSSPQPSRPAGRPVGERLRRAGIGAWSIIGIIILIAMAIWALLKIRIIFAPLGLALLIIYILNPIVSWLERRRVPRAVGTVAAYVVVLGGIAVGVLLAIPVVSRQVTEVRNDWPEYRTDIVTFVDDSAQRIEDTFGVSINTEQVPCLLGAQGTAEGDELTATECDQVTNDLRDTVVEHAGQITEIGSSVLEGLLVFIIAPLIALYLLIDLPRIQRDFLALVPEHYKDEVSDVSGKVGSALGGFFRGQLVVAIVVGLLSAIGFRIIGLPFWFVVAAIAGFFNLVPLIGPYIGGAVGFFVGVIADGLGLGIKAIIVELIVQQIDNHIISPNVMKKTVNLHPATVMLALLAGGAIAGFWGVLLAVPIVAVVKLVMGHIWQTRVLGKPESPVLEATVSEHPSGSVHEEAPAAADEAGRGQQSEDGK